MELTNEQKEAMHDAVKQCCLNADCKTIAKIFECAKWQDRVIEIELKK